MTIEEIKEKYHNAIRQANEECKADKMNYLKEHNLDGKVKRNEDGRIGFLDLDSYHRICFYPMKKDGTRSLNSSSWFFEEDVTEKFEPYTEDAE